MQIRVSLCLSESGIWSANEEFSYEEWGLDSSANIACLNSEVLRRTTRTCLQIVFAEACASRSPPCTVIDDKLIIRISLCRYGSFLRVIGRLFRALKRSGNILL